MEVTYTFEENPEVKKAWKTLPSDFLEGVATQVLSFTTPHIPQSTGKHGGTMQRDTVAHGVRGSDKDYYLTSGVDYASYVWVMNDDTTHWSTPNTHSQWFAYALKRYGQTIVQNAIDQSWKENM